MLDSATTGKFTLFPNKKISFFQIEVNIDELSQPVSFAKFFNNADFGITDFQDLRTLRLSQVR